MGDPFDQAGGKAPEKAENAPCDDDLNGRRFDRRESAFYLWIGPIPTLVSVPDLDSSSVIAHTRSIPQSFPIS